MPGLEPRNNAPPCPGADGTTIGSQLQFNLFCAHDIEGDVIDTLDARSLPECAEFCANTHPRCNAFTFSDNNQCRMISNADGNPARNRFRDAGVAQYPVLGPSGCTLGGPQALGGGQFTMNCGTIVNGGDLAQRHHPTLEACAGDCAVSQGCVGFSFNAGLDLGFMNCYLKSEIGEGSMGAFASVDTGVLNAAVDTSPDNTPDPQPAGDDAGGGGDAQPSAGDEGDDAAGGDDGVAADPVVVTQPAETVTEQLPGATQVITVSPDANAETPLEQVPGFNTIGASQNPGGILFTPSRAVATRTLVQLSTSASSVISVTQLVTVPADVTPTGFAQMGRTGDGDTDDGGDGANMAWVAAPVVGGIAAVMVVVVMFIMFRKKKRRNNANASEDGGSGGMLGFVSRKRMPDISESGGGMLGFWKPNNAGAERLGSSGDEKPTSKYMVKDGKSVPRPGSEPHRPMTGLFRSRE